MTLHLVVNANDVIRSLTGGMRADLQALDNGAKRLLLDGRHYLQAMRQLNVEGHVGWIQLHVLVSLNIREAMVTISEAEGSKLSKLGIKVAGIMHRGSTFVGPTRMILNFSIAFEK